MASEKKRITTMIRVLPPPDDEETTTTTVAATMVSEQEPETLLLSHTTPSPPPPPPSAAGAASTNTIGESPRATRGSRLPSGKKKDYSVVVPQATAAATMVDEPEPDPEPEALLSQTTPPPPPPSAAGAASTNTIGESPRATRGSRLPSAKKKDYSVVVPQATAAATMVSEPEPEPEALLLQTMPPPPPPSAAGAASTNTIGESPRAARGSRLPSGKKKDYSVVGPQEASPPPASTMTDRSPRTTRIGKKHGSHLEKGGSAVADQRGYRTSRARSKLGSGGGGSSSSLQSPPEEDNTSDSLGPGAFQLKPTAEDDTIMEVLMETPTLKRQSNLKEKEKADEENGGVVVETADEVGTFITSARVVDEDEMEQEIARQVQMELDKKAKDTGKDGADHENQHIVMGEAIVVKGEDESLNDQGKRTPCIFGVLLLVVILAVGLGIGLWPNDKNTTFPTAASMPTESPTPSPTSDQCTFCYGGDELDTADFSKIIISQIPLKTCQDVFNEIAELSVIFNTTECRVHQAEAALRCGCITFPPLESIPTESITNECRLCPVGFEPLPTAVSGLKEECTRRGNYVAIKGSTETEALCERLIGEGLSTCRCSLMEEGVGFSCFDSINDIIALESIVTDVSVERTYYLCPNTEYVTGYFDPIAFAILGGQLPLASRSNVNILCGADGRSSNQCVVKDGTFGVLYVPATVFPDFFIDNVHIEGVTFRNLTQWDAAAVGIYTPSNITFQDCIFEDSDGAPMLYSHIFKDASIPTRRKLYHDSLVDLPVVSSQSEESFSRELQNTDMTFPADMTLKFDRCLFRNSKFVSYPLIVREAELIPLFPDVYFRQSISVVFSQFEDFDVPGYISVSSGGTVTLIENCFTQPTNPGQQVNTVLNVFEDRRVENDKGEGIPTIVQDVHYVRPAPNCALKYVDANRTVTCSDLTNMVNESPLHCVTPM